MNDIPLESAPTRPQPVFSPPPPIRASVVRFDDQLRRAESAPRIDSAASPPAGDIAQSDSLDDPGIESSPVKLRARHPKRAAKNVKEPSPDGVPTVLHASRNPTRAPVALPSEPIDVAPQIPAEPLPQPPLRFNIEAFTGTTQNGAFGTPSPVTLSTEPLSLVTVVAPIAPCDAPEAHAVNATSIDAIDPLPQITHGVVPLPAASGPTSPAQSHDSSAENAEREPKESPSSRAAQVSVEFAERLLKHLDGSVSTVGESSLTQPPDGDSAPPDAISPELKDGTAPINPAPSDPAAETPNPADARGPRTIVDVGSRAPSQRAEPTGDTQGEVDRVRFIQRVSRAFQSFGNQEGHVRLRLSPPSLGALTLEVTLRGGEMVARLETETAAAKNLLLDGLPALRERLSQHEVRIARFDVDLADHTSGGPAGRHAHPDDMPRRPHAIHRAAPSNAPVGPTSRRSPATSAVSLDVLI